MKALNDLLSLAARMPNCEAKHIAQILLFLQAHPFALFPEVDKTLKIESKIRIRVIYSHSHMDPDFTAWTSQLV